MGGVVVVESKLKFLALIVNYTFSFDNLVEDFFLLMIKMMKIPYHAHLRALPGWREPSSGDLFLLHRMLSRSFS